jgi:hypothetical protein
LGLSTSFYLSPGRPCDAKGMEDIGSRKEVAALKAIQISDR